MADTLSLLFELDADGRPAIAEFQRVRRAFASEIESLRKSAVRSFTLPPLKLSPSTGARGQVDAHVKEFRQIEAEAARSARAQEAEQRNLNRSVESLQRQRSAAIIAGWKAEERAAAASLKAQERAAQQASRAIANAFRSVGPGLQSAGRTLTIGITAPLLALGAASLKSAKDLDANVNTLKAFTGSAEAAEVRLAQLIKTARQTPGLTTDLALTLDAQLRVAKTTQQTIDRVLPSIGRLNAVSKLPDAAKFTQNLLQLVTQNFEKQDLKELVGSSPLAGQLITEIFKVDSPVNAAAIRKQAQKFGLTTVDAFFTAFAEAAERNPGLANVTESIGTRFDKLVDRVTVALRPLGLAILKSIEPFIEPVAKVIEQLGSAFDSLPQPVKTAVIVFAALAAAAGPVLIALGSIVSGLGGVIAAASAVATVIGLIGFPELILVIGGLVTVITEWAAILGVLGLAWQKNLLNIRGLVSDAATAVSSAFERIRVIIDEIVQRILPTLQSITTKVLALVTIAWQKYGQDVIAVVSVAFTFVTRVVETFLRVFGNIVDLLLKLIDGDFKGAWAAFARIVLTALQAFNDAVQEIPAILARAFARVAAILAVAAIKFYQAGIKLTVRLVAGITTELVNSAPKVRDALIDMFTLAAQGFDPTSIAAVMVGRFISALQRAAASSPTTRTTTEQGLARIRLNPDGSLKTTAPPPNPTDTETKGADAAARRRIRLLELEADKVRTITDAQLAREQIAFDERKKSLEDYTKAQIAAAGEVLLAQLAIYKKEREEAQKIRNKSARDLALAEVGQREFEAQQAFSTKVAQLEAAQRKQESDAAKAHRQSLLDIEEDGDRKQLELIDSYVERYLISFEEAERRRIEIEEKARDRRRAELETQLSEAGENAEEQQRVKDAIAKLDAESATAREEAENRKRRAIKATLEAEQEYYDTLHEITLKGAQLLREAATIDLGRLVSRFGDRRRFRLESLRLEREANEEEHEERLRQIERARQDAEKRLEGVRDAEEKLLALRRHYADLEKAENDRRAAERRKEEDDQRNARDPFLPLRRRFENFLFDIRNTNDSIADSLASISEQVNSSIGAMADALRQGIVAWILYGESLGKALKKALAEQLATLTAEFAIQALKHAAYALGSLAFGDFAGAARHAAAAAAFTAAAAATGIAGRALAKSAGLYKPAGATAASGVSGSDASPRNQSFNYGGQGPVETSSQAARDGSGGILGRLVSRIEAVQEQNLQAQKQQALHNALVGQALSRLGTARPGDVVTVGAADARQAIGVAVIQHSNSSGDFNETLQRNLGLT